MEKIGTLLIEQGVLSVQEDTDQEHAQEHLQGRRGTRSNRLERARRHLDMWGRRGRGQPGRYWRGGMMTMGPEVVEEIDEDNLNDSGYFGDMDMFEDDIETITDEILD